MITHEMPDMVQENLVGQWKLPIGLCVSAQLLRLRSEGPSRRCSAAKSYELAPSHCLPRGPGKRHSTQLKQISGRGKRCPRWKKRTLRTTPAFTKSNTAKSDQRILILLS